MTTDSSGFQEAEIHLEGAGVVLSLRGPVQGDDDREWAQALGDALGIWSRMVDKVREGERTGPASAGFTTEQSAERRNHLLPGGTGARSA